MAKRSKPPGLPRLIHGSAQKLFESFPIARGEDTAAYEELMKAVMEALQPKDVIEAFFARDVVDNTWMVQRLRSIEAAMLTHESALQQQPLYSPAIQAHLEQTMRLFSTPLEVFKHRPRDDQERERLEQEFARDHPEEYKQHLQGLKQRPKWLEEALPSRPSKPEPTQQTVSADDTHQLAVDAFKKNSREIDQISRLIALHESRRNTALRELERYQAVRRARSSSDEILDAEYTEAPPPPRQSRP